MAKKPMLRGLREYEIVDARVRPDRRGELGGVRIQVVGEKRIVKMTDKQAKYYLDQGTIRLIV